MASWGKVTALLRGVLRSPRSLKTFAQYRTVGRGIVASVIGTGVVCYYRYHVNNRTLPFAVYAKEEKVSGQVSVVKIHRKWTVLLIYLSVFL